MHMVVCTRDDDLRQSHGFGLHPNVQQRHPNKKKRNCLEALCVWNLALTVLNKKTSTMTAMASDGTESASVVNVLETRHEESNATTAGVAILGNNICACT